MLIVQKYGGTSVGNVERIKNVARRCLAAQRQGHKVAVIVSAMASDLANRKTTPGIQQESA